MYKIREYPTVKNFINISIIHEGEEKFRNLEINIISDSRLTDGGAAILRAGNINHRAVKIGNRNNNPLVK